MPFAVLTTLIGYMLVSSFTPGPGNILALNTTSRFGWKKSRVLLLGICTGYLCVQTICTLTVYSLNTFLNQALDLLKYGGCIYMIWLAVHIIRSKPESAEKHAKPLFMTGFWMQLVNVKIYFYLTTLVTAYFIVYYKALWQLYMCGLGAVLLGSIATLVWAFLGVKLQSVFNKYYQIINWILGIFLLYCAWNIIRS